MSFILPLLFIICTSGTMTAISEKRFEETLPVSLMFSTLVVFITGFFGQLLIGYFIVLLIAIAFPVMILVLYIRKRDISSLSKNILTPGFCVFIIIYIVVFLLNLNKGFTRTFDEFAHWGPMVKETLRLNKFYSVPESVSWVHKDYPPIVPLFEAMWCKLCGGYQEAYLFRSLQTLSLSLFLPALSNLKWKKSLSFFIKSALITVAIFSVAVVTTSGLFYNTVLIDSFLGLMLAYSISIIFYEKAITKFLIFKLVVSLSFLLLTKQMGLAFFVLVLVIFIVNYIVINKRNLSTQKAGLTKKNLSKIIMILCIFLIPYLFIASWNYYISLNNISSQFNISAIKISQLLGIAKGTVGESWQHQAMVNFIKAILTRELVSRPVPLAYWQIILVSVIVFWIISKYGKKYFEKYQIGSLNFLLCLGAVGYAFAMLLLYVFCFGPSEGPDLADFNRYINTYLFAVVSLAMMLFLFIEGKKEDENKNSSFTTLMAVLIFMWTILLSATDLSNFKPALHYNSTTTAFYEDANFIKENTKPTDKIFIVSQNADVSVTFSIKYLIMPQDCNYMDFSLEKPGSNNKWSWNLTPNEWLQELSSGNYNYLYLRNIDQYFISNYSKVFKEGTKLKNGQLYRINKSSQSVVVLDLVK